MVKINGKELDVAGTSIKDYLESANYDARTIVVERNLEIVPKDQYEAVLLQDCDEIEIVSFMGGGSYANR